MTDPACYPEQFREKLQHYPSDKQCAICGKPLAPKVLKNGSQSRLEVLSRFIRRETCGQSCAKKFRYSRLDQQQRSARIAEVKEMLKRFRKHQPGSIYCRYAEQRLRELKA